MANVKIYTTNYCGYCTMAKRFFTQNNIPYEEISLEGKDDLRQRLSTENGGWRTVPMIFIGSEFVGGYNDIIELHRKGTLIAKIKS